ncbi:SLATT domain-containing protein [Actinocrispum sp. NPDC049592]|uniref:SLATT domain-containing protein n=1 Tax=Actinocrispum sp. NPDC049592 TaxID=3154835 RepID=UPI0034370C9F
MKWPWRSTQVPPSELGFFQQAGRRLDLPVAEALIHFREQVSLDLEWTDTRKRRFRRNSVWLRGLTLGLTAASTVVLGVQSIPDRASWALPLVAMVTVLGTLETFFNWRSRWVLMEEAQYRFNRLRDEIDYYLVSTPSAELARDRLAEFFARQQGVWDEISTRWLDLRKLDRPPTAPVTPGQ